MKNRKRIGIQFVNDIMPFENDIHFFTFRLAAIHDTVPAVSLERNGQIRRGKPVGRKLFGCGVEHRHILSHEILQIVHQHGGSGRFDRPIDRSGHLVCIPVEGTVSIGGGVWFHCQSLPELFAAEGNIAYLDIALFAAVLLRVVVAENIVAEIIAVSHKESAVEGANVNITVAAHRHIIYIIFVTRCFTTRLEAVGFAVL